MNTKQKKLLIRIIIAAALFVPVYLISEGIVNVSLPKWAVFALFLVPYLTVGWDILRKAALGVKNRKVFDECFLMTVATLGAIALGEYGEGVAVMLLYQVGELFQSVAVGKSRRSISALMDIRPDYANIERDGQLIRVDPDEVEIGTVITVNPGEKIPIDGVVESGESSLNTSALTGESVPRDVKPGDEVVSGCINMSGVLRIRTAKAFGESTVSKVLDLVENASSRKSRSENFIARSRGTIRPSSSSAPRRWRSCRRWSGWFFPCRPNGANGSTGPSRSWSSAAPARWSSASRSASLPVSAVPARPVSWSKVPTTWRPWQRPAPLSLTRPAP